MTESVGDQFSVIKITYKTPNSNGEFEEYALMQNKYLSMLSAGFTPLDGGLRPASDDDILVYTELEKMPQPHLYAVPDEGDERGISSVAFLKNVRNISVIMKNVKTDPHGYIGKK